MNRRKTQNQQQEADFFRVTAWRELGENCAKFLMKGRKVAVVGPVSVSTYTGNDGKTYANLEVRADDVEFLSSLNDQIREQEQKAAPQPPRQEQMGFTAVETDELPFE